MGIDKPKTVTIKGKTFEVPDYELYCEKCATTNYFYSDNTPPFKCDNCGAPLDIEKDGLPSAEELKIRKV